MRRAVACALAHAFDLLRHKARRAPEGGAAEEAPMSERSEFGRRAASAEERRGPMQLHRIGARPGASGFGYFCRNKSNPLKAEAFDACKLKSAYARQVTVDSIALARPRGGTP